MFSLRSVTKMNQVRGLSDLVADGWIVQWVFEASTAPCPLEEIQSAERATGRGVTHVAMIWNPAKKQGLKYMVTSPEELELLRCGEKEGQRVVRQLLSIRCGAKNIHGDVSIRDFVPNLTELTGWEISVEDSGHEFFVKFHIDGDSEFEGHSRIEQLEEILIALSIKNQLGFEIRQVSWSKATVAFPLTYTVGKMEKLPELIDSSDLERLRRLRASDQTDLLSCIAQWYCQVSPRSRLIYGFSLLEGLLDQREKENILTKDEMESVLVKIREVESVAQSKERLDKIRQALCNSHYMFRKTRNERIASKVSSILGVSELDARTRIQDIAKLRGSLAHTASEGVKSLDRKLEREISDACKYIESVLLNLVSNSNALE